MEGRELISAPTRCYSLALLCTPMPSLLLICRRHLLYRTGTRHSGPGPSDRVNPRDAASASPRFAIFVEPDCHLLSVLSTIYIY